MCSNYLHVEIVELGNGVYLHKVCPAVVGILHEEVNQNYLLHRKSGNTALKKVECAWFF